MTLNKLSFVHKLAIFLVLLALSNMALLGFIWYSLSQKHGQIAYHTKKMLNELGANTGSSDRYSSKAEARTGLKESNEELKNNPKDLKALYRRAKAYAYLDKHEEALKDINSLIGLEDENSQWYDIKAEELYCLEREADAVLALDQAIKIEPKLARYLYRADYLYELGRNKEALQDLNKSESCPDQYSYLLVRKAKLYEKCGDYIRSLSTLNDVINKEEEDVTSDAREERAQFYVRQGNYDAALEDYDSLNSKEENQKGSYFEESSYVLEALGKNDAAKVEMEEGIRVLEKSLADSSPADLSLWDQVLELQLRKRLTALGEPAKSYEQAVEKALQRTYALLDSSADPENYCYALEDLLKALPPALGHKLGEKILVKLDKNSQEDFIKDAIKDTRSYLGLVKPEADLASFLKNNNIFTLTTKAEEACDQGNWELSQKFVEKAEKLRPSNYYPLAARIKLEIATKKLKEASAHLTLLQKRHGMMRSQTANLLASLAKAQGNSDMEKKYLTLSAAIGDDEALAKLKALTD
jgi:tetratricopeptide (TPR) repeat protein